MTKLIKNKKAVSEIIGTVLLLGMAIALFTGVHLASHNIIPFYPNMPSVRISGAIDIDNNRVVLAHNGGDPLPFNTNISFSNDKTQEIIGEKNASEIIDIETSDGDNFWNIGERLIFRPIEDVNGLSIKILIIDLESNSIILQSTFQG
jgi:flagellin-like protein